MALPLKASPSSSISEPDWDDLVAKFGSNLQGEQYAALRRHFGLELGIPFTEDVCSSLGVGFAPVVQTKSGTNSRGHLSWAERDASGHTVGIGLRSRDHTKFMYFGSNRGLIYECDPDFKPYEPGPHNWIRTMDAGIRCPICGKPDGCLLSQENPSDPNAVVCCRIASPKREGLGFLHIRKPEGRLGGKSPLYLRDANTVVVVEGLTDTLTAITLGYTGIGCSSAHSKPDELVKLLRPHPHVRVIIFGENDRKPDSRWPGREGAIAKYNALRRAGIDAVIVMPPSLYKDLRAWYVKGNLTREQFDAHIKSHAETPDVPVAVSSEKVSQAELLIQQASDDEFFHDGSTAYVRTSVVGGGNRRETFEVMSAGYAAVLSHKCYVQTKKVVNAQSQRDAQNTLRGKALYEGPEHKVHVRIAVGDDADVIYLDLADDQRRVVRITPDRWEMIDDDDCPVYFTRPHGLQPLPPPIAGGSLDEMRPLLNLPNEDEWVICCGWLISLFMPTGTKPILAINGPQGSGKSNASKMLRRLVDPNEADLRPLPNDDRDMVIAARNAGLLAFDNLSSISPAIADTFCRLSSGSGYSARRLYTDSDETLISVHRSILLNGIPTDTVSREDARDRTIVVMLPMIDAEKRRSEIEVWESFERVRPSVMGALLTAVSRALACWRSVRLNQLPRMADFARWVVAAEPALPWEPGAFLRAYMKDRETANSSAIENSVVGATIMHLLAVKPHWSGTCLQLMGEIERLSNGRADRPRTPKAVGNELDRLIPALEAAGVKVHRPPRTKHQRMIHLTLDK